MLKLFFFEEAEVLKLSCSASNIELCGNEELLLTVSNLGKEFYSVSVRMMGGDIGGALTGTCFKVSEDVYTTYQSGSGPYMGEDMLKRLCTLNNDSSSFCNQEAENSVAEYFENSKGVVEDTCSYLKDLTDKQHNCRQTVYNNGANATHEDTSTWQIDQSSVKGCLFKVNQTWDGEDSGYDSYSCKASGPNGGTWKCMRLTSGWGAYVVLEDMNKENGTLSQAYSWGDKTANNGISTGSCILGDAGRKVEPNSIKDTFLDGCDDLQFASEYKCETKYLTQKGHTSNAGITFTPIQRLGCTVLYEAVVEQESSSQKSYMSCNFHNNPSGDCLGSNSFTHLVSITNTSWAMSTIFLSGTSLSGVCTIPDGAKLFRSHRVLNNPYDDGMFYDRLLKSPYDDGAMA